MKKSYPYPQLKLCSYLHLTMNLEYSIHLTEEAHSDQTYRLCDMLTSNQVKLQFVYEKQLRDCT